MKRMETERASDEVPFLADEEKDMFPSSRRSSRRTRWAQLLPYSAVLNVVLLLALLATYVVQRRDPNKAYIPNEIYCKSTLDYCAI